MVYIRCDLGKCHAFGQVGDKTCYFNVCRQDVEDVTSRNVQIYEYRTEKLNTLKIDQMAHFFLLGFKVMGGGSF